MATNPNVLFKRGKQQNLPSTALDGVFYLTTDTHRLYVGQDNVPVLLNQTVNFVDSIAALTEKSKKWTTQQDKAAHEHDLYYVLPGAGDASNTHGGNILAVWCYDKTQNDYAWVQINPDHNTFIKELLLETTAGTDNDASTYIGFKRSDGVEQGVTFNIKGSGKTIEIEAAADGKGYVVTGDTYTLSRPNKGEIKLSSGLGQAPTSIKLIEGDNVTIDNGTNTNEIKISSQDTRNNKITTELNDDGSLYIAIEDSLGVEKTTTTVPLVMTYGASDNLTAHIGGNLSVYSKSEIDTKLKNLNGLTFIGSVGNNGTYQMDPANYVIKQGSTVLELHNGDMFLVADDDEVQYGADAYAKTGDLLIATGQETDGKLTSVTWTYVPSGDDAQLDTSYHFDGNIAENSMTIRSKTTFGDEGVAGKITFNAGTATTVTSAIDGNTAEKDEFLTVTVGHANVDCDVTNATDDDIYNLNNADTVDVVTGITVNAQGHVTDVVNTRVAAPRYKLEAEPDVQAAVNGVTHSVTIKQGLILGGNNAVYQTTGYKLQSDSLKITANGSNIQVDCVWGDF